MSRPESNPLVGFYFYPQAHDPRQAERAKKLGRQSPPTDIELSQRKDLRRYGPNYYKGVCYIDLAKPKTNWNDSEPKDIEIQLRMLEQLGADFIAVDCYAGYYGGKPYSEHQKTLEIIADEIQKTELKFYTIMCLRLPRSILPLNQANYQEPNRDLDLSLNTFQYMHDYSASFWNNPNYLKIDDRPVLGMYGLTAEKIHLLYNSLPGTALPIVRWMKTKSSEKSYMEPFMIGIADIPIMIPVLERQGFDLITNMCGLLANFPQSGLIPDDAMNLMFGIEELQRYEDLLTARMSEAYGLAHLITGIDHPCHYIPSLSLGYDPRVRAQQIMPLLQRGYPYSPAVQEPTLKELELAFRHMRIYLSTIAHTLAFPYQNKEQPLVHVFAANEIGEGACVYPRMIGDKIDRSRYDTVAKVIASLKQM